VTLGGSQAKRSGFPNQRRLTTHRHDVLVVVGARGEDIRSVVHLGSLPAIALRLSRDQLRLLAPASHSKTSEVCICPSRHPTARGASNSCPSPISLLYSWGEVPMSVPEHSARREVGPYIEHARQMLDVAEHNLADGFYES